MRTKSSQIKVPLTSRLQY